MSCEKHGDDGSAFEGVKGLLPSELDPTEET